MGLVEIRTRRLKAYIKGGLWKGQIVGGRYPLEGRTDERNEKIRLEIISPVL